jgi:hypothetical protein
LLASVLVHAAAIAQPMPQPGDDAESYILRWNTWAEATDPDQSAMKALQDAVDDAKDAMRQIPSRHGENAARWAIEAPFYHPDNWALAVQAAAAIKPHTERVRAILAGETLAPRYIVPEQMELVPWDQDTPASYAEVLDFGESGAASSLWPAVSILRIESDFAMQRGNTGLVFSNALAMIDVTRHYTAQPDLMNRLHARACLDSAVRRIAWLLTHSDDLPRDALLERLQSSLVAFDRRDPGFVPVFRTMRLAQEGTLLERFEPGDGGKFTPRGKHVFGEHFKIQDNMYWSLFSRKFIYRVPPTVESDFAPVEEQLRVYRAVSFALERDLSAAPHARQEFESAVIFQEFAGRDDAERLAPALSYFSLSQHHFAQELSQKARLRATVITLALFRYHARHGSWPVLLDTIDEDLLPIDPVDPYSGELFGYAVRDGLPVVWSAGPDRDNDGGRRYPSAPPDDPWFSPSSAWFSIDEWSSMPPEDRARYDGDIMFFPPEPAEPGD